MEKREIKFRGKRVDNGEWVYGLLNRHFSPSSQYFELGLFITFLEGGSIIEYEVDPETIGQCLPVFDKNDKQYFEGDIFDSWLSKPSKKKYRHIVKWCNKKLAFEFKSLGKGVDAVISATMLHASKTNTEIIGNVFDNPSLLTK